MNTWKPISELVKDVHNKEVTALELVQKSLKAIEAGESYKAIISVINERAIERAKEIDKRINQGDKVGRLAGVPFIAKDNFLTFGSETTAASNMLRGFNAPYQSSAINRLEDEGAICVAKANLDAFAHGSSTENSDYMITKNPEDASRVPGGSSGGSAAAVMLDMAPFALGTDTGGSIRLPASFTGAVGFKPSYGVVSRSGVVAMASSTDVIGPLTKSVEDAQTVLSCISGKDELDSTTIDSKVNEVINRIDLSGKTFGVVEEFMAEGIDDNVKNSVQNAINEIKEAGGIIKEVSLPSTDVSLACYYVLVPAEISSNLSRYDGQRFVHTANNPSDLKDSYETARSEGFGAEAKRRIMIGTYVLSSGYYDAYYRKAQIVRTKIINEFESIFKDVDVLLGPVAPTTAFKIGENTNDPLQMYLADVMTVGASLAGLPAISIPAKKADGLPVGLQLIGNYRHDNELLSTASSVAEVIT